MRGDLKHQVPTSIGYPDRAQELDEEHYASLAPYQTLKWARKLLGLGIRKRGAIR